MAERIRIRVSGFRPPFVISTSRQRIRPVTLVRPMNLIGVAGAAWVFAATFLWGTPHVLLATTSTGTGPYLYYSDCAYTGLDGRMTHLRGTSCPLFRLLRSTSRR